MSTKNNDKIVVLYDINNSQVGTLTLTAELNNIEFREESSKKLQSHSIYQGCRSQGFSGQVDARVK